MSEVWHFIQEFWGLIFGAGGILATFLYYTQTNRLKKAEATASEITNLTAIISELRQEIGRLQAGQRSLEERLNDKDKLVSNLYKEIEDKDKKNSIKRRSINCAFECKYQQNNCPVLMKLAELEK